MLEVEYELALLLELALVLEVDGRSPIRKPGKTRKTRKTRKNQEK